MVEDVEDPQIIVDFYMKQEILPLEEASLDLQTNSPVKTEYGLPLVLLCKIHEGHQNA